MDPRRTNIMNSHAVDDVRHDDRDAEYVPETFLEGLIMGNKWAWLYLFFIILVIAALVLGGYILYEYYTKSDDVIESK